MESRSANELKKGKADEFEYFEFVRFSTQSRDRTGMEVNPLVFETSASTDSAIWAFDLLLKCDAKVDIIFNSANV